VRERERQTEKVRGRKPGGTIVVDVVIV